MPFLNCNWVKFGGGGELEYLGEKSPPGRLNPEL